MKILNELMRKTQAERNEMIDTGLFNGIIKGYLALTLQSLGYPADKILEAKSRLNSVFDEYDAKAAKDADLRY